ncbi:uncharacterized protein K02A2.6-like [Metopolophium dirhodum]|uniref:uncharacterized protein K02A2.6-like n=1 Tax=Metopolophium dirhodum TaxID=44670 RepID=UPI0029903677|nr:uncharacterized protein K02A2.6-like [Metopolophium dirhodum]
MAQSNGSIVPAPAPLDINDSGTVINSIKLFKSKFDLYLRANELDAKPDGFKVAVLLSVIGDDAYELLETLNATSSAATVETIFKTLQEYYEPKYNVIIEQFNFFRRKQEEFETFDKFLRDIKTIAKRCNFGDLENTMVKVRIVLGVKNRALQERLLRAPDLTLSQTVEHCKSAELAKQQQEVLHKSDEVDVHNMTNTGNTKTKSVKNNSKWQDFSKKDRSSSSSVDVEYDCKKCGRRHGYKKCFAFGKSCIKCGKLNHFAVGCRDVTQLHKEVNNIGKNENIKVVSDNEPGYKLFDIMSVEIWNINAQSKKNGWSKIVKVNDNCKINFKLDTGSDIDIIPIKDVGSVELVCEANKEKICTRFIIVDDSKTRCVPILGLKTCIKLRLINRSKVESIESNVCLNSLIKDYKEVFDGGLGCFPGEYKIKIKENSEPRLNPPRRVPESIKEELKNTLSEMCELDVIVKVERPMSWSSNLVIVEKRDKSLRVCLDPVELNKVIIRDQFLIPTLEELRLNLNNKNWFTLFDLKNGFWQIKLDEQSSNLCTFSTPFGFYRFTRLPFGLSCAPEDIQKRSIECFGDINNVYIYFDDLLIATEDEKTHDEVVIQVLERAKKFNIKFNCAKVKYKQHEIKYVGMTFSNEGMKPDEDRVKALLGLKPPKCKLELQRLLGAFNYLRQFIPNMSTLITILRDLLKKMCVGYGCDSSQTGLGSCLLQEGRPVAFSSRSLNEAEQKYPQIEKEMLSIVYACRKFHNYVYGHVTQVMTDHSPLVSIFGKNFDKVISVRLQKMKMKLIIYDLHVEYLPGKLMFIADLLSRNYLDEEENEQEIEGVIHAIEYKNINVTEIAKETENDEILKSVVKMFTEGWPKDKKQVPECIRHYWRLKENISMDQGILYYDSRIVIPSKLKLAVLKLIHEGHNGTQDVVESKTVGLLDFYG